MKTKKLLSVILSLVITISSIPLATVSVLAAQITPSTPQKNSSGVYQIGTAEELYGFAQLVNGGNPSASAVLTADIVVNTGVLKADGNLADDTSGFTSWTPIARNSRYTGKFDGQNHTISGLYFDNSSADNVGLFGYLGTDGEIKNVGVIDSYLYGKNCVSGVCGYNYRGTITGCYNTGTVKGDANYISGVCGFNNGTMTGCYNTGTVSGTSFVGGVCGWNHSGTITGCYNTGTVSGTGNSVGGVCGVNQEGKITGCYNTGTVSGSGEVGGVCGRGNGAITGCYNTGTVSGSEGSNHVGGVCGDNYDGTITGCYTNSGGVCGVDNGTVTNCEEYTGDQFKDGTVCALLNKAIGSSYDVTFYQGEEIPVFLSKTSYQYCTVNYAVAPTYTVTIPQTVTLGQTATIKAENVILEQDKQLKVTLTGTSETDNAFKAKSAEGAELTYTVNDGTKDISIDETVLTVNPDNSDTGSATLKFNAPSASDIIYAGKYTGTVTFTVSVERG